MSKLKQSKENQVSGAHYGWGELRPLNVIEEQH